MFLKAGAVVSVTLVGACLLFAFPDQPPSQADGQETYQALKSKAGKDPHVQVKLALWCEAHGLDSERLKHLAQAVLSDPKNVTARGLMGLIAVGERWESIDQAAERVNTDADRVRRLSEYAARRAKLLEKEAGPRIVETRSKANLRPEVAYRNRSRLDESWRWPTRTWAFNEQAAETNQNIIPVIAAAADAPDSLKDDEEAGKAWWSDQLGYSYQSPPQVTIVQNSTPPLLPPPAYITCFVAGTPVRTLNGPRPIEAVQVGDQVLSQEATNGMLRISARRQCPSQPARQDVAC